MRPLVRYLWYLLRRSAHDAELRDEIESHRAHRQDAFESRGLAPTAAVWASRRAMGNVTLAVEDVGDVWIVRVLDSVRQDVRDAIRGLRKSAGVSAVVIGTLALGIGANTSLFSIFNTLIMRPLPVRDPGTLALLSSGSWSYPVWEEIKARETDLFDGAFAWSRESFDLVQGGRPVPVDGAFVSGRFFDVLAVPAFRGRMLTPSDDKVALPNGPVAVISDRFWRQQFAGAGCRRPSAHRSPPGSLVHHRRRHAAGLLRRRRRPDGGRDAAFRRRADLARQGKRVGRLRPVVA